MDRGRCVCEYGWQYAYVIRSLTVRQQYSMNGAVCFRRYHVTHSEIVRSRGERYCVVMSGVPKVEPVDWPNAFATCYTRNRSGLMSQIPDITKYAE